MKFSRLKSVCFHLCLLALLRPLAIGQTGSSNQEQVIPAGTEIQLTLQDPVSSKLSEAGDEVIATVRRDVIVEGRTLLQRGTEIVGRVTLAEQAKRPFKGGRLHLTFERVRFSGHEQKITALIKSASDFTRDEKIKTNSEGTLDGGKDGGKVGRGEGALEARGVGIAQYPAVVRDVVVARIVRGDFVGIVLAHHAAVSGRRSIDTHTFAGAPAGAPAGEQCLVGEFAPLVTHREVLGGRLGEANA